MKNVDLAAKIGMCATGLVICASISAADQSAPFRTFDGGVGFSHEGAVAEAAQPPYVHFCLKKLYKEKEGMLYCNWETSFGQACFTTWEKAIEKGSIIEEIKYSGKCSNGDEVISIKHY